MPSLGKVPSELMKLADYTMSSLRIIYSNVRVKFKWNVCWQWQLLSSRLWMGWGWLWTYSYRLMGIRFLLFEISHFCAALVFKSQKDSLIPHNNEMPKNESIAQINQVEDVEMYTLEMHLVVTKMRWQNVSTLRRICGNVYTLTHLPLFSQKKWAVCS